MSINDHLFRYICVACYLNLRFLLPDLSCIDEFEFSWFSNSKQLSDISILKIEMLFEFQNKTNIEIIAFWLILFGFPIDL